MTSERECAYCLDIIESSAIVICESCGAAYHTECLEENCGCAVRGCPGALKAINIEMEPDKSAPLQISRQAVESAAARRSKGFQTLCMKCGKNVPDGELHCTACQPVPELDESTINIGPVLVLLLLLCSLLAWVIIPEIASVRDRDAKPSSQTNQSVSAENEQE